MMVFSTVMNSYYLAFVLGLPTAIALHHAFQCSVAGTLAINDTLVASLELLL